MPLRVDLNADMGEGAPSDARLMLRVTSANIACGGHAGDGDTMRRTVELAIKHRVGIGAHPSFADRTSFGRKETQVEPRQLTAQIVEQVQALRRVAELQGATLSHVKPHGALYNMAARDEATARAVIEAMKAAAPGLALFALAGSKLVSLARAEGIAVAEEVFADRGYRADGSLVPRGQPGAMVESSPDALERVIRMVKEGRVAAVDGGEAVVHADTICIHGDEEGAHILAQVLRSKMRKAGIYVKRFGAP